MKTHVDCQYFTGRGRDFFTCTVAQVFGDGQETSVVRAGLVRRARSNEREVVAASMLLRTAAVKLGGL